MVVNIRAILTREGGFATRPLYKARFEAEVDSKPEIRNCAARSTCPCQAMPAQLESEPIFHNHREISQGGRSMADKAIEVLLTEKRNFPPPKEFKKSANMNSAGTFNSARKNPQAFWAKAAKELHWFKPWTKVLEWKSPWAKWFIGGKLNVSYNCLDRHVNNGRKNKAAIIWEGEPGDERVLTYRDCGAK